MKEIDALKREIEFLKKERDALREENELLAEKAMDIALLGVISEKITISESIEEVISVLLENICVLKELGYASFVKVGDECLSVIDDYCIELECSLKEQCFELNKDIFDESLHVIIKGPEKIPPFVPEEVKKRPPVSACILRFKLPSEEGIHFLVFVNYFFDPDYIEQMIPLIKRVVTLATMKIEGLMLFERLKALNQHLEDMVRQRTKELSDTITRLTDEISKRKELEERLKIIYRESRDGIVLIDTDTGMIVDCNPAFEEITGRPLEVLKKMHVWQLRPPELRQKAIERFHEIRHTGMGGAIDLDIMKPDGTRRPIEFLAKVITIGNRKFTLSVVRDISERNKLIQSISRKTKELEIIHDMITKAQATMNIEDAITEICNALKEFLNPRMLMFYRFKDHHLELIRGFPETESVKEKKDIGICLCGLAAERRKIIYSSDILKDPLCTLDECKKAGMRSFVAIPLHKEETLIGLIGLAWSEIRDFSEEREFFETLGAGLSVVFQNMYLFDELKKHSYNLESLVRERTDQLQRMVNLMAGREVRMAELKEVIKKLRNQLIQAGLEPVADDPLRMDEAQ